MGVIGIALIVILVVSACLLVLIVLVQDEQGEGIGGIFGGGSSTPFGSRSGNVLTRFTAILAAVFLITIVGLAWVAKSQDVGNVIGASRQQSLNTSSNQTWYEPTSPTGTPSTGTTTTGTSTPGAPAPAAAPAGTSATGTGGTAAGTGGSAAGGTTASGASGTQSQQPAAGGGGQ